MTLYKCNNCNKKKDLKKTTIIIIDDKIKIKEAKCDCGFYMESKPAEGMPSLIRTEPTLKKK